MITGKKLGVFSLRLSFACVQRLTKHRSDPCFPVHPLKHLTPSGVLIGRHWWLTVNLWLTPASLVDRKAPICTRPNQFYTFFQSPTLPMCFIRFAMICHLFFRLELEAETDFQKRCASFYSAALLLILLATSSLVYLRRCLIRQAFAFSLAVTITKPRLGAFVSIQQSPFWS